MKPLTFKSFIMRMPLYSFYDITDPFFYLDFQEAIYIASPTLYKELIKYLTNTQIAEKEKKRILHSLERYLSRMSTRCTPFGLFAGCSIGEITESTEIVLKKSFIRKTRLDMHFLCTLYDSIIKIPEIRKEILFFPNTSIYSIGKKYRYIEYVYINTKRKYLITEIEKSQYIDKILKTAQKGATISTLTKVLVSDEISSEAASDFINELIDSQIILGELSQAVTGEDYLERVINRIRKVENTSNDLLSKLENIYELLKKVDKENGIHHYEKIKEQIQELNISYEEKFLFQVDISPEVSVSYLSNHVVEDLKTGLDFLNKITQPYKNKTLTQFETDFYDKYENMEIPLLQALDTESGLGYPSKQNNDISPLVDNLALPYKSVNYSVNIDRFQSLLLKKAMECLSNDEIELFDEDVKGISSNWDDLPPTFSVMFELLNADNANTLIKINSCGGSSAANLIGRFAHLDERIESFIKEITKKEQELYPNKVVAEIVHLPESRIGNILFRPHIREYEILYLASSDLPDENIIHLSDLTLSIKNNRLVIWSKKLKKEIIPRLTTAHNYYGSNSMPIYKFLCDMQIPTGRKGLFFSWGEINLNFYPRVRYKNIILLEATWKIKSEDIKHLYLIGDDNKLIEESTIFREKYKIHQQVLLPDGDNELFVDWINPVSIRSLFSVIKERPIITFKEFLFDPNTAVVRDIDGKPYLNEFIVAFYKDKK